MGVVAGGHVTIGEGSVVGVDELVTTGGQVGHVGQVVGAVVGGGVGGHVTMGGQVGGGGQVDVTTGEVSAHVVEMEEKF